MTPQHKVYIRYWMLDKRYLYNFKNNNNILIIYKVISVNSVKSYAKFIIYKIKKFSIKLPLLKMTK